MVATYSRLLQSPQITLTPQNNSHSRYNASLRLSSNLLFILNGGHDTPEEVIRTAAEVELLHARKNLGHAAWEHMNNLRERDAP